MIEQAGDGRRELFIVFTQKVIAHLQMLPDFLAGEAHHVELVLIFIEVEHVAYVDRTRLDGGVELQGAR